MPRSENIEKLFFKHKALRRWNVWNVATFHTFQRRRALCLKKSFSIFSDLGMVSSDDKPLSVPADELECARFLRPALDLSPHPQRISESIMRPVEEARARAGFFNWSHDGLAYALRVW